MIEIVGAVVVGGTMLIIGAVVVGGTMLITGAVVLGGTTPIAGVVVEGATTPVFEWAGQPQSQGAGSAGAGAPLCGQQVDGAASSPLPEPSATGQLVEAAGLQPVRLNVAMQTIHDRTKTFLNIKCAPLSLCAEKRTNKFTNLNILPCRYKNYKSWVEK